MGQDLINELLNLQDGIGQVSNGVSPNGQASLAGMGDVKSGIHVNNFYLEFSEQIVDIKDNGCLTVTGSIICIITLMNTEFNGGINVSTHIFNWCNKLEVIDFSGLKTEINK